MLLSPNFDEPSDTSSTRITAQHHTPVCGVRGAAGPDLGSGRPARVTMATGTLTWVRYTGLKKSSGDGGGVFPSLNSLIPLLLGKVTRLSDHPWGLSSPESHRASISDPSGQLEWRAELLLRALEPVPRLKKALINGAKGILKGKVHRTEENRPWKTSTELYAVGILPVWTLYML